jgi:hypothetical protein
MSSLTENQRKLIIEIYYDPSRGLTNPKDIYRKLHRKITLKDITEFVKNMDINQIYKPRDKTNFIPISADPYTYQIDLLFLEQYKRANSGYIGLLVIIEITSRKLWAYPIKSKNANEILNIMKNFINNNKVKCIESDKGNEFMEVKKYCEENDILYIMINKDDSKNAMAIVERVNRTIREKITKYQEAYDTYKYIDVIEKLINNYNNTIHRTLNATPNTANINIEQYHDPIPKIEKLQNIENEFNINDKVRILKNKKLFEKGSQNYTKTIYKIIEKNMNGYVVENEKTKKRVLPHEMQKVEIEKIIKNPKIKNDKSKNIVEKDIKEKQQKRKIKKEGLDPIEIEKNKKLERLKRKLEY